jgi:hypothetical protein
MAMEACCGAHHLGRVLRQHVHEVRLMSPEYVQPYVKADGTARILPEPENQLSAQHGIPMSHERWPLA